VCERERERERERESTFKNLTPFSWYSSSYLRDREGVNSLCKR